MNIHMNSKLFLVGLLQKKNIIFSIAIDMHITNNFMLYRKYTSI